MSATDYSPLIDKIKARITSWTARHLSFAGRLQLISSVIHSLTNFWMAAYMLPKKCIDEIDSLCSAFLWSGPDLNPRKAKIAWRDVCKPKEEGGLGLKSLTEANVVSCLKLFWRIVSCPASLWVQWIQKYLIRKGSIWTTKQNSTLGSWMWKKILKLRGLASQFLRVEVMNGSTVSFWFDKWCCMGSLIDVVGPRGCLDMGIKISATLEQVMNGRRRRRNHRNQLLNHIETELQTIRSRGQCDDDDIWLWKGKNDVFKPSFSTKETWLNTRQSQVQVPWAKTVWFSFATPKYSMATWLAIHDRLSTGFRLQRWNATVDASCKLCTEPLETRDHIFFTCAFSTTVWENLAGNLFGPRWTTNWSQIMDTIEEGNIDHSTRFLRKYVLQITVHSLWSERNARLHGEKPKTPEVLIHHIDKGVRNKISSIQSQGSRNLEKAMVTWFASRAT